MEKYDKANSELMDKLEKDKLESIAVYTVEIGYHKWSTHDKDAAFKLWQSLVEGFFSLENLNKEYNEPQFLYRKPVEVKLVGEKIQVWKDQESALRAHNAFNSLKERAVNKSKIA
jgi:hypothetical protein